MFLASQPFLGRLQPVTARQCVFQKRSFPHSLCPSSRVYRRSLSLPTPFLCDPRPSSSPPATLNRRPCPLLLSDRSPSSSSALRRCCSLRIFCACDVCDTDALIHQSLRLRHCSLLQPDSVLKAAVPRNTPAGLCRCRREKERERERELPLESVVLCASCVQR